MKILCVLTFMLFPILASAQSESDTLFQKVAERLYTFQNQAPREKVYVHQDRMRYAAGETIWFKAYRSFTNGVSEGSNIVYVDLVNRHNEPVIRSKWKLTEGGIGNGHIVLPDSLIAGQYQLRAYTRWMQNFDTDGFFTRDLYISSTNQEIEEERDLPSSELFLSLFPEGGNLVAGIPSGIAFKINDMEGKGKKAKGVILDENKHKVADFESTHNGMGYFNFEPEAGKNYSARLDGTDNSISFPEIQEKGVVLRTRCTKDNLRLTLQHNLNPLQITPCYLTIHQQGIVWFNAFLDMSESTVVVDIDSGKLPVGIFTITVYDNTGHAYCERLAFVNFPEQLDLKLSTDKQSYAARKQVKVMIDLADQTGQGQSGDFSLAVVKAGLDDTENRNNYYTDYFLKSDLRGRIEHPASYFKERDLKNLNLLLMVHGWRRYIWDEITMEREPLLYFPVEKDLTFSGKIQLRNERQKPESVELVAAFRHDSIDEVISTHPAEGGIFMFHGYDFCDTAEVILSAKDKRRTLELSVMKHPDPQPDYFAFSIQDLPAGDEANDSISVEWFGLMPVKPKEGIDKVVHELPEIRVTSRYKKRDPRSLHDSSLNKATYQVKKNFSYGGHGAWGILEYNNASFRSLRMKSQLNYDDEYARNYILDGMYVSQKDLEMIPASFIDRIEILSIGSSVIYGGRGIFFYTRSWEDIAYSQPVKTISYKFAGYSQSKEFYAPDYTYENDYFKPDHRNTLHWQPDVKINEEGKAEVSFFTSDDKGEYVIHCEGRSDEGVIGVEYMKIEID